MIDQKFVDYIRNQLAAGIAKEDIRKVLTINGLSEQDIAEGFVAVTSVLPASSARLNTLPQPASIAQATVVEKSTSIWAKGIPRTNWTFMVISLALVFGLDLAILYGSGSGGGDHSLLPFWIEMLIVFGIFAVFFLIENYWFSKKFSNTKSSLDPWISGIIVVRNLIFLLNFIPLIQILGMMLLAGVLAIIPAALLGGGGGFGLGTLGGLGGIALITPGLFVLYVILIACRFFVTKQ